MAMFDEAKAGEKVWSIGLGWGKIEEIDSGHFPIVVRFNNGHQISFTSLGHQWAQSINPTLFWDEIKIAPPEKPNTYPRKGACGGIHTNAKHDVECSAAEKPKEHKCNYEKVHAEHCHCGNFKVISYRKPKEECEACKLIEFAEWRQKMFDRYTEGDLTKDKFLLNQHHTCEKGK